MSQQPRSNQTDSGPEGAILALVAFAASIVATLWLGAELAALLSHRTLFKVSSAALKHFVSNLPANSNNPKLAWPPEIASVLPGPIAYWICSAIAFVLVCALSISIIRLFRPNHESLDTRKRMGSGTNARLATTKDLKPMLAKEPNEPGRVLLGRFGRQYVLTERARTLATRTRRQRNGAGAVMMVGPSRSGKSTLAIQQILNWTGPAIIVSVKGDLLDATLLHRSRRGDVKSFDPTGDTRLGSSCWSPLRNARTITGAMQAASQLTKSAPNQSGVEGAAFFQQQAESLLSAMLAVAAVSDGQTMSNVAQWINRQDMPKDGDEGLIAPLLRAMCASTDPEISKLGQFASDTLIGFWSKDNRTMGSVYGTANNIVWPWIDPIIGSSADGCDIDLQWLMSDGTNNTLYVNAPLADKGRVSAVLGGLLGDIVNQVTQRNLHSGALDRQLLILIDEAGNVQLDDLPEWASVLAGLGVQLVTVWQSIAQIRSRYKIAPRSS